MSYITASEVKEVAMVTYGQVGFATDLAYGTFLTNTLIPQAQDLMDNYVGHDFLLTEGTICLDGSGKGIQHINRLGLVITAGGTSYPQLLPLPLVSVTGVSINNTPIAGGAFQVYKTYITYENNYFTKGRQNVDIAATWGYGTISGDVPDDIKYVAGQVCANVLRNMLKRYLAPDILTRAVMARGGLEAFYAEDAELTPHLKDRLNRYRFSDIGVG